MLFRSEVQVPAPPGTGRRVQRPNSTVVGMSVHCKSGCTARDQLLPMPHQAEACQVFRQARNDARHERRRRPSDAVDKAVPAGGKRTGTTPPKGVVWRAAIRETGQAVTGGTWRQLSRPANELRHLHSRVTVRSGPLSSLSSSTRWGSGRNLRVLSRNKEIGRAHV